MCLGGRSKPGRAANIDLDCKAKAVTLYEEYCSLSITYAEHLFERRYRVSRATFLCIGHELEKHVPIF